MKLRERLAGYLTGAGAGAVIAFTKDDPAAGAAIAVGMITGVEVLGGPITRTIQDSIARRKSQGCWLQHQRGTGHVAVVKIQPQLITQRPTIQGQLYDRNAVWLTAWCSNHVEVRNSGRELIALYSGTAPDRLGRFTQRNVSGLSRLTFADAKGLFREGAGHFVDDLAGRNSRWIKPRARTPVRTHLERIDPTLFGKLGLPPNFDPNADASEFAKLIGRFSDYSAARPQA